MGFRTTTEGGAHDLGLVARVWKGDEDLKAHSSTIKSMYMMPFYQSDMGAIIHKLVTYFSLTLSNNTIEENEQFMS